MRQDPTVEVEPLPKRCLPNNSWRFVIRIEQENLTSTSPDYVIKIINKEGQTVNPHRMRNSPHLKKAFGEGFNPFFHMKESF